MSSSVLTLAATGTFAAYSKEFFEQPEWNLITKLLKFMFVKHMFAKIYLKP